MVSTSAYTSNATVGSAAALSHFLQGLKIGGWDHKPTLKMFIEAINQIRSQVRLFS